MKNSRSVNCMLFNFTFFSLFLLPKHGVILHEFGHALGLMHEAKRGDRVQYISVNSANIQPGMESQFTIDNDAIGINSTYEHSNEYDYCSIMHYSSTVCVI